MQKKYFLAQQYVRKKKGKQKGLSGKSTKQASTRKNRQVWQQPITNVINNLAGPSYVQGVLGTWVLPQLNLPYQKLYRYQTEHPCKANGRLIITALPSQQLVDWVRLGSQPGLLRSSRSHSLQQEASSSPWSSQEALLSNLN